MFAWLPVPIVITTMGKSSPHTEPVSMAVPDGRVWQWSWQLWEKGMCATTSTLAGGRTENLLCVCSLLKDMLDVFLLALLEGWWQQRSWWVFWPHSWWSEIPQFLPLHVKPYSRDTRAAASQCAGHKLQGMQAGRGGEGKQRELSPYCDCAQQRLYMNSCLIGVVSFNPNCLGRPTFRINMRWYVITTRDKLW